MPKYNETSVVGESWKRAFQILIENFYNKPPKIRFSEEEIFVAADGRLAGSYNGEGIEDADKKLYSLNGVFLNKIN